MAFSEFFKNGARTITRRTAERRANTLGLIPGGDYSPSKVCRSKKLELLDAYYDNRQYEKLLPWDQAKDASGAHVPIRNRSPRFKYPFAKHFAQRVSAKLVGGSVFPSFLINDFPEDQEFIRAVIRESKIKSRILEPVRRMLGAGSVLVRFYLSGGAYKIEWFASKFSYPTFQDNGELESVTIKYTYEDAKDLDSSGKPKIKWYRLDLGMESETLFDNPEFHPDIEPEFTEVEVVDHGLGFVQAEWFRTADIGIDGYSINEDILSFIDELNYSTSQSSNAVSYNQDPQLVFQKMDAEEMEKLVRSVTKSWNLGQNGDAKFLESNLTGVQRAIELRDKIRTNIQDFARVVLLDPEKIVGSAQSAKAMEVLHGPMLELIDEIRPVVEDSMKKLVLKMALAALLAERQGIPVPIIIPPGYQPKSLDIELSWPDIFPQTIEDLQKKVNVASTASTSNLIARKTATKWLAKDFGIENVEEELAEIASQPPPPNPFGGF